MQMQDQVILLSSSNSLLQRHPLTTLFGMLALEVARLPNLYVHFPLLNFLHFPFSTSMF